MRLIPIALPLLLLGLAYLLDLPKSLGAHPWWSREVLLYAAVPGLALGWLATWAIGRAVAPAVFFASGSLAAWGIAASGKARFAASFAEDALAAQAWFFGWIGTAVLATAALTATGTVIMRSAARTSAFGDNAKH
jgi:hypothetical protein